MMADLGGFEIVPPGHELEPGDMHAYGIGDLPGVFLALGVPKGQNQPAIMLWSPEEGKLVILGRFHGELHMYAAIRFLDDMSNQVNRVIQFHELNNLQLPHQDSDDTPDGATNG